MSPEQDLIKAMSDEMCQEIDRKIIQALSEMPDPDPPTILQTFADEVFDDSDGWPSG